MMELKGNARCGSRVPAGPSARESPEGFTHILCKPLRDSQVGTHKYTQTHTHTQDTVDKMWRPSVTHTHSCRLTVVVYTMQHMPTWLDFTSGKTT